MRIWPVKIGFSLVEAVVAGVVFTIAVAAVFASIASLQKPAGVSDQRLFAALCAQRLLENMRAKVDARDWKTGSLSLETGGLPKTTTADTTGLACPPGAVLTYTVSDAGNGAKKVDVSVTWN